MPKLKSYSHSDSELQAYKETLDPYVGGYRARNVPFWVFIDEEKVVGIVVIDKEPLKLIDPIGTQVSVVLFTDYGLPENTLNEFASGALQMAQEHDAAYSFIDLPYEQKSLVDYFLSIGYKELAHTLRMQRDLDEEFKYDNNLRFENIGREEVNRFLDRLKLFMSGSPDEMLNIVLGNLRGLPDMFIDHWYQTEQLYYVYNNNELIGVLNISPQYLNIANIGVSPDHRRRGYGRQMMLYAMSTLKEQGHKHGALRVHAANTGALQLYESLGFSRDQARVALLWRK